MRIKLTIVMVISEFVYLVAPDCETHLPSRRIEVLSESEKMVFNSNWNWEKIENYVTGWFG